MLRRITTAASWAAPRQVYSARSYAASARTGGSGVQDPSSSAPSPTTPPAHTLDAIELATPWPTKEKIKKVRRSKVVKVPVEKLEKRDVQVLLAKSFEMGGKIDPTGWWMSEKLDGIRAYWDGEGHLWSRLGNPFYAPPWFTAQLPRGHTLDGELFHSRNSFDVASSIVRSHDAGDRWGELKYQVFDIPSAAELPFEDRLDHLCTTLEANALSQDPTGPGHRFGHVITVVPQVLCECTEHLMDELERVQKEGGEGLMLREPGSLYVAKRSKTLLKVKTFLDAEAVVVGYEDGKGKYEGFTGSLICAMESGLQFAVGSGLTDAQRADPPLIGAIVTYRFQEYTKDKIPRFPRYVGERIDADKPKDAVVPSPPSRVSQS